MPSPAAILLQERMRGIQHRINQLIEFIQKRETSLEEDRSELAQLKSDLKSIEEDYKRLTSSDDPPSD